MDVIGANSNLTKKHRLWSNHLLIKSKPKEEQVQSFREASCASEDATEMLAMLPAGFKSGRT